VHRIFLYFLYQTFCGCTSTWAVKNTPLDSSLETSTRVLELIGTALD